MSKIVVIGGVAGGASAAAKARRVDEQAEIVVFEKGPYVSFANCGLPYYISGQIPHKKSLLLQTPESFWKRFRVQIRVLHEVLKIDRESKTVIVKNLQTLSEFEEKYDTLVLSPGAQAVVPPMPGITLSNIFTVKTVPEADLIKGYIEKNKPKTAAVIGAGFIGLEMAEALHMLGLHVTVIEKLPQVLPPLDAEMADFVSRHLMRKGIHLVLNDGIKAFHGDNTANALELESGNRVPMDLAILSIGVRPELKLAKEAGLTIGEAGGIEVDECQQTSDPSVFAAGDAVESISYVSDHKTRIPLAGPANKQGRAAGANAAGQKLFFTGAQGTAIVKTMGITAAKTGFSAREAVQAGFKFFESYTHSSDHATYYPGADTMHIKLVVEQDSGRVLGAQIVGKEGVDKRIDVLAAAVFSDLKVFDLEKLDLAYAPQFSSAKDPVIMAGFAASNVLRKDVQTLTCEGLKKKIDQKENFQLVDVRTPGEFASGHLPGAVSVPIDDLRERISELDSQKQTIVYCRVGLRGYLAYRILKQNGFQEIYNLSGGILSCQALMGQEQPGEQMHVKTSHGETVPVQALKQIMTDKSCLAIDVREKDEFSYEHIQGTSLFPLSRLSSQIRSLPKDKALYVFCQSGVRTNQAVRQLREAGYAKVHAVSGGLNAWKSAGYEIVKRKGPIPIMRQVQIVAGSLAFIGGIVPQLRIVAVVVGAGLIFAGISGLCGMARVLEKMPWNKQKKMPNQPDSCESNSCQG